MWRRCTTWRSTSDKTMPNGIWSASVATWSRDTRRGRSESRSLEDRGTDESVWLTCPELRRLDPVAGTAWLGPGGRDRATPRRRGIGSRGHRGDLGPPRRKSRVGCRHRWRGKRSRSSRRTTEASPQGIRAAAAALGTTPLSPTRSGFRDGRVRAHDVEALLVPLLEPGDVVLAPWADDGHPDHDEVGWAAQCACAEAGACLLAYLVWAWHWAQPGDLPWEKVCRVELDDAVSKRKRQAVQCFVSQLAGPQPILSFPTVRRLTTDFEVFVSP